MWQHALVLLGTMNNVVVDSGHQHMRKEVRWQYALVLLDTMDNVAVEGDTISYNAAISR